MKDTDLCREFMKEHGGEFTDTTTYKEFIDRLYAYLQEKNPLNNPDWNIARYSATNTEWAKFCLQKVIDKGTKKFNG